MAGGRDSAVSLALRHDVRQTARLERIGVEHLIAAPAVVGISSAGLHSAISSESELLPARESMISAQANASGSSSERYSNRL